MPTGKPRSLEAQEATLLAQLENLRQRKAVMEKMEAFKNDAVAQGLIAAQKAIAKAMLVPDVASNPEVLQTLERIQADLEQRLEQRRAKA